MSTVAWQKVYFLVWKCKTKFDLYLVSMTDWLLISKFWHKVLKTYIGRKRYQRTNFTMSFGCNKNSLRYTYIRTLKQHIFSVYVHCVFSCRFHPLPDGGSVYVHEPPPLHQSSYTQAPRPTLHIPSCYQCVSKHGLAILINVFLKKGTCVWQFRVCSNTLLECILRHVGTSYYMY